jgi:hypothetical protein
LCFLSIVQRSFVARWEMYGQQDQPSWSYGFRLERNLRL